MFETRVLWQKYRNQKEVDKQSKFESELIIVTLLKEPLMKLPGMYILYHIHLEVPRILTTRSYNKNVFDIRNGLLF